MDDELHDELFTLNIGPHHPATHGVLRLLTTLEGEVVRDIKPIIGYVHTGIEKSCEDQQYWKVITFVERMDYLAYYFNATAYCMSVEKLLEEEVPPRAQYLRVVHMELNRIASHLFALATGALDLGAITMLWWGCRDRDLVLDLFEMSSGQRMHPRYIQVGGVIEDIPPGWEKKVREFLDDDAHAARPVRGPARPQRDLARAAQGHRRDLAGARARAGRDRAAAARHRPPLGPAQGDALLVATTHFDFDVPVGHVGDNYDRFKVRMDEMRESMKIVEQALDGLPEGPLHHHQPQGRAAAAPRAGHLDGGADPPLQARDRGLPRAARRGLRGDRVAARRARLLRARRRLGQARARAHARPELREPAEPARHGAATR